MDFDSDSVRKDSLAKQCEGSEPKCCPLNFGISRLLQNRVKFSRGTPLCRGEIVSILQCACEFSYRRVNGIQARIQQFVETPTIVHIYDQISPSLGDPSEFPYRFIDRLQPGQNPDGHHQAEMATGKYEAVDISNGRSHPLRKTRLSRTSAGEIHHLIETVHGIHPVAAVRQRNRGQPGSTANLQNLFIGRQA